MISPGHPRGLQDISTQPGARQRVAGLTHAAIRRNVTVARSLSSSAPLPGPLAPGGGSVRAEDLGVGLPLPREMISIALDGRVGESVYWRVCQVIPQRA